MMMAESIFLLKLAEKKAFGHKEFLPVRLFSFLRASADWNADIFIGVYTTLKTLYTVAKPGKKSVFFD